MYKNVVGRLREHAVETKIEVDVGFEVVQGTGHIRNDPGKVLGHCRRPTLRSERSHRDFDAAAHFEDVGNLHLPGHEGAIDDVLKDLRLQRRNTRALADLHIDQPDSRQTSRRLPDHRPADAEVARQLDLTGKFRSRSKPVARDMATHMRRDIADRQRLTVVSHVSLSAATFARLSDRFRPIAGWRRQVNLSDRLDSDRPALPE